MQQVSALPSSALELKDIHLPEQIANYPVAYGWWLLAALIIFMIVVIIIKIRKTAKRNQVKKQALAQLTNNTQMTSSDIIVLLKWAAMHYFSRAELAKLFGDSLKEFLALQLPTKHQQRFNDLSKQAFVDQYQARSEESTNSESDKNLQQAATLWLNQALPPKPLKNKTPHKSTVQGVSA